jgi:hypothetical protein
VYFPTLLIKKTLRYDNKLNSRSRNEFAKWTVLATRAAKAEVWLYRTRSFVSCIVELVFVLFGLEMIGAAALLRSLNPHSALLSQSTEYNSQEGY